MKKFVSRSAMTILDTILGLMLFATALLLYTETTHMIDQQRHEIQLQLVDARYKYETAIKRYAGK